MKRNPVLLATAAWLISASSLVAAQGATAQGEGARGSAAASRDAGRDTTRDGARGAREGTTDAQRAWERSHRASRIIGTDVRNRQGEKIGDIKDLILDRNGTVTLAVISTGGFLGMGDRLHAVPWSALQAPAAGSNDLVLDVDKARLKEAPGFDSRSWPNLGDEKWLSDVRRAFRIENRDNR